MRHPALRSLLAAIAALCSLAPIAAPADPAPSTSPSRSGIVTENGLLRVSGNRIVGRAGQPVSLAGNSFFWSQWMGRFYTQEAVGWLREDWQADIVRAALGVHHEDGYQQHPKENLKRVTEVVDAAIAQDIYVIVDWHDHHAHRHTADAIRFFEEIARRYGRHPHLIYEIYNEPLNNANWARDVKPYAEKVIAAIRAIDPDNLIVVGTPTWSQDVDIAAADPIKDANVAYALHFYAGTHKTELRLKAARALSQGAALFVTEWGTCNADGNGPIDEASVREWMTFLRTHHISHLNWAVSDKRETASILVPGASARGGWKENKLTKSGRLVRKIIRDWREDAP
jgi:endoglucanase